MRLAILLIVLLAGPASAHDRKAQSNASTAHRSWTAPVFFGYGAAHRRAVRDAYCREQIGPHMPMGC